MGGDKLECKIDFIEYNTRPGLIELWQAVIAEVEGGNIMVPPGSELKLLGGLPLEEIQPPRELGLACKCTGNQRPSTIGDTLSTATGFNFRMILHIYQLNLSCTCQK